MRFLLIFITTFLLCKGLHAQVLGRPAPTVIEVEVKMFGHPSDATYIACSESDECATAFRKTIWLPEAKMVSAPQADINLAQAIEPPRSTQTIDSNTAPVTTPSQQESTITKPSAPKRTTRSKVRRASQINCTPVQAMPRSGGSKEAAAKKANPQTIQE